MPAAWERPATKEDVIACASYVLGCVEPESHADPQRVQMATRQLASRDYSRAEMLLIAHELPADPDASHNYGRGFNLADAERIVKRHREARAMLSRPVTSAERDRLITEHPELDPDGFKCCGYGSGRAANEPLWRYVPQVDTPSGGETPTLDDKRPPRRSESTAEGDSLGEILRTAQEKSNA